MIVAPSIDSNADEMGRKDLLAIEDGYRESAQSWREVLVDLKRRGLKDAPVAAEDIARVASGILENPEPHAGQRYVITGSKDMKDAEI